MLVYEGRLHVERCDDGTVKGTLDVNDTGVDSAEVRERMASVDNSELAEFVVGETDSASGEVAWGAGGVVPVVDTDKGAYIPLSVRDSDAPSHVHHFASASGMSDDETDIFEPKRIGIREGVEEILYACQDDGGIQTWAIPRIDTRINIVDMVDGLLEQWEKTADTTAHVFDGPTPQISEPPLDRERVPAEVHQAGDDVLTITCDGREERVHGHLAIDPIRGALDLMQVLVVDMSETPLSDIRFLDGEESDADLVNRDVYLFSVSEFIRLTDDAESVTAHRRYKGGQVWNGVRWTNDYEQGIKQQVREPLVTPNMHQMGTAVRNAIERQS